MTTARKRARRCRVCRWPHVVGGGNRCCTSSLKNVAAEPMPSLEDELLARRKARGFGLRRLNASRGHNEDSMQ
jgi:hypothetical protein